MMFRVEVTSSDGHKCGVPVQVDNHPAEQRPYALNAIADSLLVERNEIHRVLAEGTEDELLAHLSRYTKDQLKPLHMRSEQPVLLKFFAVTEAEEPSRTRQ
jgi:hypothetical protein